MKSILIVDDSAAEQFYMEKIIGLFDPSVRVDKAGDGQEALDILQEGQIGPDLILLDINMPRMNGHQFLEQYASRPDSSAVIVMITSSAYEEDRQKAEGYGCVMDFREKPLTVEALSEIRKKLESFRN